eukprot:1407283-Prymnesium_polylepis.1
MARLPNAPHLPSTLSLLHVPKMAPATQYRRPAPLPPSGRLHGIVGIGPGFHLPLLEKLAPGQPWGPGPRGVIDDFMSATVGANAPALDPPA